MELFHLLNHLIYQRMTILIQLTTFNIVLNSLVAVKLNSYFDMLGI